MEKEQNKTQQTDIENNDVIKAIRQEYEEKIAKLQEDHVKELEDQKKKLDEEHIKTIHELFKQDSGLPVKQQEQEVEEKSFEELVEESLRQKLKI